MSSLKSSSRKLDKRSDKIAVDKMRIRSLCAAISRNPKATNVAEGLLASAVIGFLTERFTSKQSKTRFAARTGAKVTLSTLVHELSSLSGVASLALLPVLKSFVVGK